MPLISDNYQKKRLDKNKVNIKTKYIVGNNILERNSNDSFNDDISSGIRCKKEYYLDNNLVHSESIFDSRIEYTFISKVQENKNYTCPNCGIHSNLKSFIDGCPYCRTHYNIDYVNKELGSKYHYDLVLKNSLYRVITAIIDFIVSFVLCFIFIKFTSRTFNSYDMSKIFIYSIILSLILYYFFYLLDAYVILEPIKRYKQRQNEKQIRFWNETKIDKTKFFNNFNYEIGKYYYSKDNIIDYDILDYINFKHYEKDNIRFIEVITEARIMSLKNNKITSKYVKENHILRKNELGVLNLGDGLNMIKCSNCGASIDVTKGKCEYCRTEIKDLQEWILER